MILVKSAEAFRTISEASKELGVPQHVLRHWEEVFGQIRPMRRAGGRRYYRPVDLDLLRGVRVLLYDERYTTKGVQKIFKENGAKYITNIGQRVQNGEDVAIREDLDDKGIEQETPDRQLSERDDTKGGNSDHSVGHCAEQAIMLQSLITRLESLQTTLDNNVASIEAILEIEKD